MDLNERVQQFRTMAEADPDNEMAHYSLGNACLQLGEAADAASSFMRAIEINPEMSKAYQMAGQAYMTADQTDDAITVLANGYTKAVSRGDLMVRDSIASMLKMLDAPLPETTAPAVAQEDFPEGTFVCSVSGRPGEQLEKPPFRGALGEKIYECISKETWHMWIGQGTKVINELRLDLSREDHQIMYDQNMVEFLGLEKWVAENQPAPTAAD